jgi:hypothetical protein
MWIWITGWYKADRKVRHVDIAIIGSIQEITIIGSIQEITIIGSIQEITIIGSIQEIKCFSFIDRNLSRRVSVTVCSIDSCFFSCLDLLFRKSFEILVGLWCSSERDVWLPLFISIYHSNECDHHQIVSFFCPSHGQELCVTCRIQHHTKCHNVFPINKYPTNT